MKTSNISKKSSHFLVINKDADNSSSEEENAGADDVGNTYFEIKNVEDEKEPDQHNTPMQTGNSNVSGNQCKQHAMSMYQKSSNTLEL